MGVARQYISADDYRVEGERENLYVSVGILAVVLLLILAISVETFFIPLIVVGVAAVWVVMQHSRLLGQGVRVSEQQFPNIHAAAKTAAERLCMLSPDVFIIQNSDINAGSMGFLGKKSVVLNSGAAESLTDAELTFLLGHEFSHIKSGDTNWTVLSGSIPSMGVPVVSHLLGFIFLFWSRKAEFTSDRGGLLACRDLKVGVSVLVKLAVGGQLFKQINLDSLMDQKMYLEQDDLAKLSQSVSTHPYTVNRIHDLFKFNQSELYQRLTAAVP